MAALPRITILSLACMAATPAWARVDHYQLLAQQAEAPQTLLAQNGWLGNLLKNPRAGLQSELAVKLAVALFGPHRMRHVIGKTVRDARPKDGTGDVFTFRSEYDGELKGILMAHSRSGKHNLLVIHPKSGIPELWRMPASAILLHEKSGMRQNPEIAGLDKALAVSEKVDKALEEIAQQMQTRRGADLPSQHMDILARVLFGPGAKLDAEQHGIATPGTRVHIQSGADALHGNATFLGSRNGRAEALFVLRQGRTRPRFLRRPMTTSKAVYRLSTHR